MIRKVEKTTSLILFILICVCILAVSAYADGSITGNDEACPVGGTHDFLCTEYVAGDHVTGHCTKCGVEKTETITETYSLAIVVPATDTSYGYNVYFNANSGRSFTLVTGDYTYTVNTYSTGEAGQQEITGSSEQTVSNYTHVGSSTEVKTVQSAGVPEHQHHMEYTNYVPSDSTGPGHLEAVCTFAGCDYEEYTYLSDGAQYKKSTNPDASREASCVPDDTELTDEAGYYTDSGKGYQDYVAVKSSGNDPESFRLWSGKLTTHLYELNDGQDETAYAKLFTCYRCGNVHAFEGATVAKRVKEPTCVDGGVDLWNCANEENLEFYVRVKPIGHDWSGETKITLPVEGSTAGRKMVYCSRCDEYTYEGLDEVSDSAQEALTEYVEEHKLEETIRAEGSFELEKDDAQYDAARAKYYFMVDYPLNATKYTDPSLFTFYHYNEATGETEELPFELTDEGIRVYTGSFSPFSYTFQLTQTGTLNVELQFESAPESVKLTLTRSYTKDGEKTQDTDFNGTTESPNHTAEIKADAEGKWEYNFNNEQFAYNTTVDNVDYKYDYELAVDDGTNTRSYDVTLSTTGTETNVVFVEASTGTINFTREWNANNSYGLSVPSKYKVDTVIDLYYSTDDGKTYTMVSKDTTLPEEIRNIEASGSGDKYTWTNVPFTLKIDDKTYNITYKVFQEQDANGYIGSEEEPEGKYFVTSNPFPTVTFTDGQATKNVKITNSLKQIDWVVTKVWKNSTRLIETRPNSITLNIVYSDGSSTTYVSVPYGSNFSMNGGEGWTKTLKLPMGYSYRVIETGMTVGESYYSIKYTGTQHTSGTAYRYIYRSVSNNSKHYTTITNTFRATPFTGDSADIMLWAAVSVSALAAITAGVIILRRRSRPRYRGLH